MIKLFRSLLLVGALAPALCQADTNAQWSAMTSTQMNSPVSLFVMLTLLSFVPVMMIALTTFTRNIVVFSLVRHALGLQQTPPNVVLIVLSLFLTLFVMGPTLEKVYLESGNPFLNGEIPLEVAAEKGWVPIRDFMVRQTHESDLRLIYELSTTEIPKTQEELAPTKLIPAFMLSELKVAFQIGFMIFLPFLIIDLIVASILMSLGMIMVPPITISLPLKIMLFLLIDGWGLIAQTLIRSAG